MDLPRRLSSVLVLVALVSSCVVFVWAPQNVSAYTLRDPIFINGDSMFTAANGVVSGSGTESDPYIIEGWEFDDMWDPGIEIWNTEAHFVVRAVYCHVASGTLGPDGMRFDSVRNGTVENCVVADTDRGSGLFLQYCHGMNISGNRIYGNSVGVKVWYSSSVSVLGNDISTNQDGVKVAWSDQVQLVGNLVYGNYDPTGYDGCGILLSESSACDVVGNFVLENSGFGMMTVECMNCSLFSNQVSGNGWYMSWTEYGSNFDSSGIAIGHSLGMVLEANALQGNGVSFHGDLEEHYTTHAVSTYNTVNDQPLRYHAYSEGVVCDSLPTGQLIVVNCTDSSFSGLDIPVAETGVSIKGSDNITISGCHLSGEGATGIEAIMTGDLRLSGNEYENLLSGLVVMGFDRVSLQGESLSVGGIAISLWGGSSAEVSDSSVGPASIGMGFDNVGNVSVERCSFFDCGLGVSAYVYDWAEFEGNEFSGCLHAVSVLGSSPVAVRDNVVSGNHEGVVLTYSVGAVVTGNEFIDNLVYGLVLDLAEDCLVYGNDFVGDSLLAVDTAASWGMPANSWDDGYPGGGNYWSNYSGSDEMSGADQDVEGPDGIGDTPYVFDIATDRYPLMHPLGSDAQPTAWFTVEPAEGGTWTAFYFDASLTYDREDSLGELQFRWDFDGDMSWDTDWTLDSSAAFSYGASGTYQARMEVMDTSGLTDTASRPVSVTVVDDVDPDVYAELSGDEGSSGWFVSDVTITVTASDDLSGIDLSEYRVEGAVEWTEYTGPAEFSTDGEWVLEVRSHDRAGNLAEDSLTFKLDATAPVTTSELDGTEVSLDASDATSGVLQTYYRIDGEGWAVYGGPFEVVGDGPHTVEYYSVDEAGNEEEVRTLEVEESSAAGWLNLDMWIVLLTMLIIIGISIGLLYGMRKRATDSADLAVNKTMPSMMAQMEEDRPDLRPKEEPPEPEKED